MTKLELPDELKYLKGPCYEPAMRMDYQYIIIEDVLPGLFYVTRFGRRRGRGEWAGRRARQVAEALSQKREKFAGFDGDREQRVLEEWLKATVLWLIERGAADKVMSIRPLYFMTYRVDLPFNWAHLRSVPEFVPAILQHDPSAEPLATGTQEPFALQSRDDLFWKAFGEGIVNDSRFAGNAALDRYDDNCEVDIESLLTMRVAEGLRAPNPITVRGNGRRGNISGFEPLCPGQARIFREDFSLFLRAYPPPTVPVRVLGDYTLCLLALNLTTYSLCHIAASNHLYRTGEWLDDRSPPDDAQLWELGIYPDLTGGHVRKSRELARQSYARHYEWMLQQLRAMIGFRLLDYYLRSRTDIRELRDLRNLKGIEFLKTLGLGRQRSCSEVYAAAQASASPALSGLERAQPNQEWPDDVKIIANDPALPPFDRLVELLASTQEDLRENMLKFFTSCSRRNLNSGLIAGSQRRREDNYYTLGSQMLETLVQLLILRPSDPPTSRPLDIYDFVKQLKERYGIWIDEIDELPPDLDQSYEARQAAQMNFAALKEKLRQIGFFRAVTDARRMQRLRQRYAPAGDAGDVEGGQDHEAVD